MKPLRAARVGTDGFVPFVYALLPLGVIDRAELRAWLELHGSLLRAVEPPLDQGNGVSDAVVARLLEEAGQ